MDRMKFSSALAYLGVLAGVCIALGLPWLVLACGQDLSASVRTTVIILALLLGGPLAAASVVIGITIPSALRSDKLQIAARCVHVPEEEEAACCGGKPGAGDESRSKE
jgi:hypothetical protein